MKKFNLFAIVLSAASALYAAPELFESIAAVVDGKPIMRSEVMSNLYQFQATAEASKMSEKEQVAFVLDKLIDDKVLLSRVDRDSIKITDDEVDLRVSQHLQTLAARQNIDMATLEKAIRAQLGMSMAQYRDNLAKQVREQMTIGRIRQKYVGGIQPTKKEVSAFYESYKDSLPRQYNCIHLSLIELKITPDKRIVDSVENEAKLLIDTLSHGMNFEVLAKRHSQDSSASKGGDIGYFQKGLLEPEYERAVSMLDNGEYTENPVRTEHGWDLIRVLGRKENGIRTARILLKTIPTSADTAIVLHTADSLRAVLTTTELFSAAAKQLSIDKTSNFKGGNLGWLEKPDIDSLYAPVVAGLSVGDVSSPVLINGAYNLLRLDDMRQVRDYNMEEDYMKIEELAINYMEDQKLKEFVKKWRTEVHIEIRMKD
ncbi:MAG: peptidylprolyl isomerase [Fibrobacteraceae bacterium]|nr:peptidylprolyl isomerase [Fibrobacteraceae bacterium]